MLFRSLLCGSIAVAGLAAGGRIGRAGALAGLAMALGMGLIWWRSETVAAPRLESPRIVQMEAEVLEAERLVAKDSLRLTLRPADPALPPKVRVSLPLDEADAFGNALGTGARVRLRARLAPPMPMALPGTHDFARDAWFMGLGATGRALGPVTQIGRAHV